MLAKKRTDGSQKATAILQGRVASTRLPGKVLLPLLGKPVIQHVYERILHCRNLDRIIVATSVNPEDDPIAHMFQQQGVPVFRGSAEDPLDRYYKTATQFHLSHVVRIMSDCPLVDPLIVDDIVAGYFHGGYDLFYLTGEFPTGLDVTVFSYPALEKNWQEATLRSEREHITPYMNKHPELFKVGSIHKFKGLLRHRWVMDYHQDYLFMQQIYKALYQPGKIFLSDDIVKFLNEHPHLLAINGHIPRGDAYRRLLEMEQDGSLS